MHLLSFNPLNHFIDRNNWPHLTVEDQGCSEQKYFSPENKVHIYLIQWAIIFARHFAVSFSWQSERIPNAGALGGLYPESSDDNEKRGRMGGKRDVFIKKEKRKRKLPLPDRDHIREQAPTETRGSHSLARI